MLDTSCSLDGATRAPWRPKEGVLLNTLKEHSGAVNRLAVSPDQSFFVSASADRTVRIWQVRQLDRMAFPRYIVVVDTNIFFPS
jgi:WD40 repeat protein